MLIRDCLATFLLDEYQPGSFRQAQISFSSRIPNALPIGDAMTMGSGVCIYSTGNINFREMFKNYEKKYVKPRQDENYNTEEPDEATEATEATIGKQGLIKFSCRKGRHLGAVHKGYPTF